MQIGRHRRYGRAFPAGVLVAAVLLTGCGVTDDTAPPSGAVTVLPADQVVFQVRSKGTFVGPLMTAHEVARLTIYGDGSIYQARVGDSMTRPPQMLLSHADPATVASMVAGVEQRNLFREPDFGSLQGVYDLPVTHVRLHGATDATVSVYGLTYNERDNPGTDDGQLDRRDRLRAIVGAMTGLVDDPQEWTPDRVRVLQVPSGGGFGATDPVWPGPDIAAATSGRQWTDGCLPVTEGAAALYAAARSNPTSAWRTTGGPMMLAVVPVLPGEQIC